MAINNYKHNLNEPLVVKDLQITGTRVDNQNTLVFTKSIQLSADNTTGGGLILSDDGDFVDLNNGFGSFRFSSGIQIYNASRGGSPGITLASSGDINLLFSGTNINFANSGTTTRGVVGTSGDNDTWFYGGGATGSNAGFAQISTGDDGNEPIYVRQYIGDPRSGTLQRTAALLDGSGYTYFPSRVGIVTTNPSTNLHVQGNTWLNNLSGDTITRAQGLTVSFAPGANWTPGTDPGDSLRNTTFAVKGSTRPVVVTLRNLDNSNAFYDLIADGSSDSFYIQRPGTSPALTIRSDNNIGIGTTNPGQLVDVRGGLLSVSSSQSQILLHAATNTPTVIHRNDGSDYYVLLTNNSASPNTTWNGLRPLSITLSSGRLNSTNGQYFDGTTLIGTATSTGTASQRLQVTGGAYVSTALGVGVTNPSNRLTVYGTNSDTTPILALLSGNQQLGFNNGAQIAFGYDGTTTYQHFIHTRHNATNTNNAIDFYVCDGTQNNTLTSGSVHTMSLVSGNVGVGTTTPTSRLHVAGDTLVTGITTLGTLRIASGIVTASSGIITYYGDGSKLSKIVGSTISSTAPSSPSAGTLWFNSELGRTFVYYDENLVGAGGTDRYWIDASPFNVGIITSLSNISFGSGSASAPSWYFDNSVTTGVFSPAAGRINFVSVGSTILSINPSGLTVTGVVTATDFNSTSDIMLKENIHSIPNPLEKVMQINGVGFRWKDTKEPSMGVIAQDIEEVLPELVHRSDHVKTVNYNGLIGVLIEAVKEQQRQIEELKALINKNK